MRYLTDEEKLRLEEAILEATGGEYLANRPGLRADLPIGFKAIMSSYPGDRVTLRSDITKLDETERLDDGRIPLLVYLRSFLSLYGSSSRDAEWLRALAARVDQEARGAPDVAQPTPDEVKEAVVHQNDMLPLAFARKALQVSAAVAKIEVPRIEDGAAATIALGKPVIYLGTGWLVANGLLLTNHHVFNARKKGEAPALRADFEAQALASTVRFDYDDEQVLGEVVQALELVAADETLDYALLRVASGTRRAVPMAEKLPAAPPGHVAAAVNIVQHPGGLPTRLAIRNNLIAGVSETDIRYFTDTEGGSSGAPVLSDEWHAVALHRGTTLARGVNFQGKDAVYMNVGTRISAIADDLRSKNPRAAAELPLP